MASTIMGLFRRGSDDEEDALADPKVFAAWLARQPANDDLGLQEELIRVLEDQGARQPKVTLDRIQAVIDLDRHSMPIQARLRKQYLYPTLSDPVRQRLWHAIDDLARWLAYTYENLFAALEDFFLSRRAKALAPAIVSRMFHYRGIQAQQGLFRYERWIPGRWKTLHDAYAASVQRGLARVAYSPLIGAPAAQQFSAEEEYLQILLMQRVNTGNLTAPQIEIAASWLRSCTHLLALAPPPLEGTGYWLDLGLGDGLLSRKPHTPQGALLYLDVAPLHAEIERVKLDLAAQVAGQPGKSEPSEAAGRLALLRRIESLLHPQAKLIERRGQRVQTDNPVSLAVGLPEIAVALAPARTENKGPLPGRRETVPWRMQDTSDSGCRLVSQSADVPGQKLGAVLAVQDVGASRWKIGIVRRLKKLTGGRIELGVEIIALHSLLISPKPLGTRRDSGYSVDGIDVNSKAKGFDALYLPPSLNGREGPAPRHSMLVPAAEYVENRQFFLNLGNTAYTVEFAAPFERAKEWVWTSFAVLSKEE